VTLSPSDLARLRRAVRHDGAVKPAARLLFEDICDLAARTGTCTASPRHFANVYDVSEKTVERWAKDLERAGYLERPAAQSDARRKGYTPSFPTEAPVAQPKKGDGTVPQFEEIGDERVPQNPEMGDDLRLEIGDDSRPTLEYIPPLGGGEGARTHEGTLAREARGFDTRPVVSFDPVSRYREAYPDVEPTIFQISQLRACTNSTAFEAALVYWLGNDHFGHHVGKFYDRYTRIASGEAGADGRFAGRAAIPGRAGASAGGGRMRDLTQEVL